MFGTMAPKCTSFAKITLTHHDSDKLAINPNMHVVVMILCTLACYCTCQIVPRLSKHDLMLPMELVRLNSQW
jgi:hypothetical protein